MGARNTQSLHDSLLSDEVSEVLRDTFFSPDIPITESTRSTVRTTRTPAAKPKPDHYKVICISLYNEDLDRLDAVVRELKKRGYTKANRSAVLRAAMLQFDPSRVPKGL